MPQVFAYLRVSTDAQDTANQKHGVVRYCIDKHLLEPVFIEDTASVGHWGLTRDELRTAESVSRKVGAVVHSRIFANELLDLFSQFLGIHRLRTIPYFAQNPFRKP
jgi:hypothetical protein